MVIGNVRPGRESAAAPSGNAGNPLSRCLSLDLEVGKGDERIHALAGVRPDTGQALTIPQVGRNPARALARLDELADSADFVLGHNLIDFDLPHLRAANPNLRLLELPAVDTLRLNPLAFPRNPYHYLVKHYQDGSLRRGRVNDPELDARLALEVFDDQQKAFGMAAPELLTAWHWLTTADGGAGFDRFFSIIRRSPRPSYEEAHGAIRKCLNGISCRTHGRAAMDDAAPTGLGTGLRAGVAVGGRGQFGDAALGATPVSRGGPAGPETTGHGLRRFRLRLVPGTARRPGRAEPVVRLR